MYADSMFPLKVTDPTGQCFLSYKRERSHEAALVIDALHRHGIPTWQDVSNLGSGLIESEIRNILEDPSVGSAILWLTPEVADSDFIQKVEAPLIARRVEKDDGFYACAVAAGGLNHKTAPGTLSRGVGVDEIPYWKHEQADTDPISESFAERLACKVLQRRLTEFHRRLEQNEPLKLRLSTRVTEKYIPGTAIVLNWHPSFEKREASNEAWNQRLYPALQKVANLVCLETPGRRIEASGQLSLVAAVLLGKVFLAPRDVRISWRQVTRGEEDQLWSLHQKRDPSEISVQTTPLDVASTELAVLVGIARSRDELRAEFSATQKYLRSFRAMVEIGGQNGGACKIVSPGQACDVAERVAGAIADSVKFVKPTVVHLFLSVPAGLAMLIGQLLNTISAVQLYEHVPGSSPPYKAAIRIEPSV
jgi:hypothetical protein